MPRKKAADPSPPGGGDAPFPTISKTDAVKAALDAGVEKPKLGVTYIKETFGLDMSPSHFSQMKTLGKKKSNGSAVTQSASIAPASSNGHHAQAGGGVAESVEAIKGLVDRMGAEEVVRIAELFRK